MKRIIITLSILSMFLSVSFAQQGKVSAEKKKAVKTTVKTLTKDYTIDSLKHDIDSTKALIEKVEAEKENIKKETDNIKAEAEVLKDNQSTWYEKALAIFGILTSLITLYTIFARLWASAKNICIIDRLLKLLPNRKAGGGTHDEPKPE